jgi:hypothetical protein
MRMDSRRLLAGVGAFVGFLTPLGLRAEATRLTNPTAFYAEIGGRGLGYGAGFDRMVSNELGVGASFGTSPTHDANDNSTSINANVVPVYLNYYLDEDQSTIFLTGGMTLVLSDNVKGLKAVYSGVEFPSSRQVLPTLGWGYENRTDGGFLFRLSGFGIWGQKFIPWVGFTFGVSF